VRRLGRSQIRPTVRRSQPKCFRSTGHAFRIDRLSIVFRHFDQLRARWRSVFALTFKHAWFTIVTQSPGPGSDRSPNRVRPSHDDAIKHTHKCCQVLGEQDIMNEGQGVSCC